MFAFHPAFDYMLLKGFGPNPFTFSTNSQIISGSL
jgi:hypothetical protein